jgi:cytochrome c peroxidase
LRGLSQTARSSGFAVCLVLLAAACTDAPKPAPRELTPERVQGTTLGREPLLALPAPPVVNARVAELGAKLFRERELSSDGKVACSSCHDLMNGGADHKQSSLGARGRVGAINALSVYNASLNFVLFWDGRAAGLEEQIDGPLTNPLEMDSKWPDVIAKLSRDSAYRTAFAAAFTDGITPENVRAAIATFERTLLTRDSPFDRWLNGDTAALTPAQKAGYDLFKGVGCVACHQGQNVGGNMFQRFGVMGDYFGDRGHVTEADYGHFNVTHADSDRFVFRVPSLRNVALTAPYFHDGSAKTLPEAVQVMAKYQLGRKLSAEQIASIVEFLGSLSGAVPASAQNGGG